MKNAPWASFSALALILSSCGKSSFFSMEKFKSAREKASSSVEEPGKSDRNEETEDEINRDMSRDQIAGNETATDDDSPLIDPSNKTGPGVEVKKEVDRCPKDQNILLLNLGFDNCYKYGCHADPMALSVALSSVFVDVAKTCKISITAEYYEFSAHGHYVTFYAKANGENEVREYRYITPPSLELGFSVKGDFKKYTQIWAFSTFHANSELVPGNEYFDNLIKKINASSVPLYLPIYDPSFANILLAQKNYGEDVIVPAYDRPYSLDEPIYLNLEKTDPLFEGVSKLRKFGPQHIRANSKLKILARTPQNRISESHEDIGTLNLIATSKPGEHKLIIDTDMHRWWNFFADFSRSEDDTKYLGNVVKILGK